MSFDGKAFGREVVALVKDYLARNLDPIVARLDAIEKRLAAVEGKGLAYRGTFQRAQAYRRGEVVTYDGSLFIALRDTAEGEVPGKAPDAWQLAVKGR